MRAYSRFPTLRITFSLPSRVVKPTNPYAHVSGSTNPVPYEAFRIQERTKRASGDELFETYSSVAVAGWIQSGVGLNVAIIAGGSIDLDNPVTWQCFFFRSHWCYCYCIAPFNSATFHVQVLHGTQIMTRRSKPTDRPVWICGLCIHTWENIVFTMPDQIVYGCIAFALAISCLFFSVLGLCPRFLACKYTSCLYSESCKGRSTARGFCRQYRSILFARDEYTWAIFHSFVFKVNNRHLPSFRISMAKLTLSFFCGVA